MNPLPRARSGLLRHPLDDQVLVYDSSGDRVHVLDQTSATVLELLQEGGWTREGIAHELAERLDAQSSADLVEVALDQLWNAGLLEETVLSNPAKPSLSRRQLIEKLTVAGASALLVPAIASLSATNAYAQTASGVGTPCTAASQCLSGKCCGAGAGPKACRQATCEESDTSNCTGDTCCYNGSPCPLVNPTKCGTQAVCA